MAPGSHNCAPPRYGSDGHHIGCILASCQVQQLKGTLPLCGLLASTWGCYEHRNGMALVHLVHLPSLSTIYSTTSKEEGSQKGCEKCIEKPSVSEEMTLTFHKTPIFIFAYFLPLLLMAWPKSQGTDHRTECHNTRPQLLLARWSRHSILKDPVMSLKN